MKKIIGIASAAVVLMAMLTACGIGVFECDLCGETKAGVKNEAGMFGKTIVYCSDCKNDLETLGGLLG